jgi:ribosomal protein L40E
MIELEKLSKDERKILVSRFLKEMYFERRKDIFEWARITKQTPLIETKFLGQNLVSLVTGIPGRGTAARGDDLSDGSEVKTCSRLDQLSKCNKCGAHVTALNKKCPKCGSKDITIMKDSHWIFTINADDKKEHLLNKTPKIYLLLIDDYKLGKNDLARFTIWTINPKTDKFFREEYVEDYYKTYFEKRKRGGDNPAPMNVHPRSPKFGKTNYHRVFEAVMNKKGKVNILKF